MSHFPCKTRSTFVIFYSFIHSLQWLVSVCEVLRKVLGTQWWPKLVKASTRSLKSSGENRHKQEKKKKQVDTNFSKCHEESKLKAVWRMDYRGKWLKIRNVLWVLMLPNPQRDSHGTFQGRESQRMFAAWQMMVEHSKKNYLEIQPHV